MGARQALQDELERSRLELEQAVKEKDSTIAAKDKEISQVSITLWFVVGGVLRCRYMYRI